MLRWLLVIRILALLLAALLFVGGCKSATHPKLKLVTQPVASQPSSEPQYPEFVTSKSSRVLGILRMLAGVGLAFYVLKPIIKQKTLFG